MGELYPRTLQNDLEAVPWLSPGTDDFEKRRAKYCASNPAIPRAILCPRNAEEVSAIVRRAREHETPFTVRNGGHDLQGRSMVQDALCIDLRDLDSVNVAQDRETAIIGGGVRFGGLMKDLHSRGLITPHGSVSSVGYVGWASLGGYGCCSRRLGLGVDQIVAAEVVNDRGEIVNADPEMLKGIRGGGGNFGIITSLTIKVYPVKTVLAGLLIFDTSKSGLGQTFKDVVLKVENSDLPAEVVLQPMVFNHPEMGRAFVMSYFWSSDDHEKGRQVLEELMQGLPGPVMTNTVAEMSTADWIYTLDNFVAKKVWGGSQSVSFPHLSPEVLDILTQGLEAMPSDPGTLLSLHSLGKQSPSITDPALADASCFNPESRQPHIMVEIVAQAILEESAERSGKWAESLREALLAPGEAMTGTYISLAGANTISLEDLYGEKFALLKSLKQKYDPEGVFRHAVPRLLD